MDAVSKLAGVPAEVKGRSGDTVDGLKKTALNTLVSTLSLKKCDHWSETQPANLRCCLSGGCDEAALAQAVDRRLHHGCEGLWG